MDKAVTAAMFSVLVLGTVDAERLEQHSPPSPQVENQGPAPAVQALAEQNLRNLLLNAFGTGQAGPNQLRIPIPADGAMYEVIIQKPGLGRNVPVTPPRTTPASR